MKPPRLRPIPAHDQEGALKTALRYLGYRARSEAEITEYLQTKGYSAALVTPTLEKLRALGYADDGDFARSWARSRAAGRGFGPARIQQELRAKGIDEPLIRSAISEVFTRDDERERAGLALKKKFRGENLDDAKTLRRAAAFLQRRGYSETVILSLLRQYED